MSECVTERFEDSYPEDDMPEYDIWSCAKCHQDFVDPEDVPQPLFEANLPREPRLYWLSVTEPLCSSCAVQAGIPPIDKE